VMPSEAVKRLLAKLPDAKRSGKGWVARCPAHDDHRASLSIAEGDDSRALVRCHAGCDIKNVVAAMELTMADLMPKQQVGFKQRLNTPSKRIVATYPYTDENGALLFEVIRYEPKDFRQRRPDGKGGYAWNMKGVRRVLYRLPDIIAAGLDSFIFIVEGEKDADRLAAEGLIPTTCPGGAGKWSKVDDTPLHGRHVVIIPDNDKAGLKHAQQVAAALHGKAASVRIVNLSGLSEKGDVSDWLDAGGDSEELVRLAENTPQWTPNTPDQKIEKDNTRRLLMRRGDTIDDASTRYLWHRRITLGSINVIFSRPGRGKSTLGACFTGHVTTGRAWPDGSACPQGTVFYLKGEGTDASIRDRMKLAGADPKQYHLIGRADDDDAPMLDLTLDVPLIVDELNNYPDTKLLIVDTLDSMYPSMRMIDNANIRACLWPLQELAEKYGLAVVVFAHTNKGGYTDPLDRLSGGRAIGAAARSVWYLGKTDHEAKECYMAPVKINDFTPGKTLAYQIVGTGPDLPGVIRWGDEVEQSAWDLDRPPKASEGRQKAEECQEWLAGLLANGPITTTDLTREASTEGYGDYVIRKAKALLSIKSRAAKGRTPPVYYVCLPDQEPPDLTEENVADADQSAAVPMSPLTTTD